MASVVLNMTSPHNDQSSSASPLIVKKKTRRAPKKQKKNKKPYFKLSWKEKEEVNEKDRMKGEARVANYKAAAPNNTTQFLMQEHNSSTPNQTPVNGINFESSDEGEMEYNSMSSDDHYEDAQIALQSSGVFMENDFAETFNNIKAETLESKSKNELISDLVTLEKTVSGLAQENDRLKHTSNDGNIEVLEELNRLREENFQLKEEIRSLKEKKTVPLTPVKDNLGFLDLHDTNSRSPPDPESSSTT